MSHTETRKLKSVHFFLYSKWERDVSNDSWHLPVAASSLHYCCHRDVYLKSLQCQQASTTKAVWEWRLIQNFLMCRKNRLLPSFTSFSDYLICLLIKFFPDKCSSIFKQIEEIHTNAPSSKVKNKTPGLLNCCASHFLWGSAGSGVFGRSPCSFAFSSNNGERI